MHKEDFEWDGRVEMFLVMGGNQTVVAEIKALRSHLFVLFLFLFHSVRVCPAFSSRSVLIVFVCCFLLLGVCVGCGCFLMVCCLG